MARARDRAGREQRKYETKTRGICRWGWCCTLRTDSSTGGGVTGSTGIGTAGESWRTGGQKRGVGGVGGASCRGSSDILANATMDRGRVAKVTGGLFSQLLLFLCFCRGLGSLGGLRRTAIPDRPTGQLAVDRG